MRIVALTLFQGLPLQGFRAGPGSSIRPDEGAFAGWRIHVRGPAVFLISPFGWRIGAPPEGTQRLVFEIPRSQCHLQWEFGELDKLEDVVKHDPAPASARSPLLADLPADTMLLATDDDLERLTAPSRPDPLQTSLAVEGANPSGDSPAVADRATTPSKRR